MWHHLLTDDWYSWGGFISYLLQKSHRTVSTSLEDAREDVTSRRHKNTMEQKVDIIYYFKLGNVQFAAKKCTALIVCPVRDRESMHQSATWRKAWSSRKAKKFRFEKSKIKTILNFFFLIPMELFIRSSFRMVRRSMVNIIWDETIVEENLTNKTKISRAGQPPQKTIVVR